MAADIGAFTAWSTTASSNQPDATDFVVNIDDNFRQIQATLRKYFATVATPIASASSVDLSSADGNYVQITGTTTITAFGTVSAGVIFTLLFEDAVTITYNGTSMILPGAVDFTTRAGDVLQFISEGSGNWRMLASPALTFDPGYTGSTTRRLSDRLGDIVSVKSFGVTGDGTTDDTAAINVAISALNANEFRHLYFPPGTYLISSTLDAITQDHSTIFGAGRSSLLRMDDQGQADGTFFTIGDTSSSCNNVTITMLAFICDNLATLAAECVIDVIWAQDLVIDKLWMESVAGGVKLGTDSNLVRTIASRVKISNIDLQMYGPAEGTGLDLQWCNGSNFYGVHGLLDTASVTGGALGIHIHPVGTDVADGSAKTCDGNKFVNCEFNYPDDNVNNILVLDATDAIIINTWFTNCVFDHSLLSGIKLLIDTGARASARMNNIYFNNVRSYINGAGAMFISNPAGQDINNVTVTGGVLTAWDDAAVRCNSAADYVSLRLVGVNLTDLENTTPKAAISGKGFRDLQVIGCTANTQRVADVCTFANFVAFTGNSLNWVIVGNDCTNITGLVADLSNCTQANGFKKVIEGNIGANENPSMYKQTTDATVTTIGQLTLPEGRMVHVTARVLARKTDDSQHAAYELKGTFYRASGGNVTQVGSSSATYTAESDSNWSCTLTNATQTVIVRGTGVAATTIDWYCQIIAKVI